MEPEFITYQKFNDPALAKELTETLEKHQIDSRIEEDSASFDPFFTYNSFAIEYLVKIRPGDFEKAWNPQCMHTALNHGPQQNWSAHLCK